jgi:hypothetical protein
MGAKHMHNNTEALHHHNTEALHYHNTGAKHMRYNTGIKSLLLMLHVEAKVSIAILMFAVTEIISPLPY